MTSLLHNDYVTSSDVKSKTNLSNGRLINFEKRRKEFELLRMVEKIQNSNEKISMNPKIRLSGSVCSVSIGHFVNQSELTISEPPSKLLF